MNSRLIPEREEVEGLTDKELVIEHQKFIMEQAAKSERNRIDFIHAEIVRRFISHCKNRDNENGGQN